MMDEPADIGVRARAFFDQAPEPMMLFDIQSFRILAVNAAALERYGYSQEEFLARTIMDIRPEEDIPRITRLARNMRAAIDQPGLSRHKAKSGEIFVADIRTTLFQENGRWLKLVSIRDVTHLEAMAEESRRRLAEAEESRKRAELEAAHFRALFNCVPGKLLVLEPEDYRIVAASDDYLVATMRAREDLLGRRLFDVFPEDPSEPEADGASNVRASLERVAALRQTDIMAVQRYPIRRPEHAGGGFEERYWSPVNTPVPGPNGDLAFIIHRAEDVTALVDEGGHVALQALEQQNARLEFDVVLRAHELQTANARLADQAAILRSAERLLDIGYWHMDLSTRKLEWSDQVYAFYGLSPGTELDLDGYVALVHEDDRARTVEELERFLSSDAPVFTFEHRLRRADGSIVHVKGAAEYAERPSGRALIGLVQDITLLRAAEVEAREAAGLLRLAGDMAKFGGWRADLAAGLVHWTEGTAAIHDCPGTLELAVETAIGFYPPGHRERITERFRACADDGTPFDEILQIVTTTGRRIWVHAIGEPERALGGRIIAVRGAFQDVTELVVTRDRSRGLALHLERTLDTMSDGFVTLDRDWRFTYLNHRTEQLVGLDRKATLGKSLWEVYPELVGTRLQHQYEKAVATGKAVAFRAYLATLGQWFDIRAYPLEDGLAIYFRDVTEAKAAEEALALSEERFRLVALASNDVVWDWDLETGTIWWNDSFASRFGYPGPSPGATAGSRYGHLHADDIERVRAGLEQAIAGGGERWQDDYRIVKAGGEVAYVTDRGFLIRDADGRARRMLGSMVDLTQNHETEARLRQAEKMEVVGQLTGGIAHDFNNLLTIILGNAELLADELGEDRQLRPMAEMTIAAAERGAELTGRLLAYSRRQPLAPKVADVNRLIAELDALLRRTLSEDIEVELVRAAGLWLTELDPGQLQTAVLNLAINARDAMPDGGKLTIETGNAHLDETYAAEHLEVAPGRYVMLTVTDTGCGMSPETKERAFEPFFTTKGDGKGNGLGLSMVYGFVKQSGGHIKIYAEPGLGTAIKLYFPRARSATAAPDPVDVEPEAVGGIEHVLVVEDDALVRDYVVSLVRGLGYRVTAAGDGPQALAVIDAGADIDLLFTDVVMPGGLNGRQLADAAATRRPGLGVLFTSGYTETAVVHNGRLDPGVQLLSKPYRRQELARKLRAAIDSPDRPHR